MARLLRVQNTTAFVKVDDEIYDQINGYRLKLRQGHPFVCFEDHDEPLSRYVYRYYNKDDDISSMLIDRIDNDPLNCTIDNLRPAKHTEDALNKRFKGNKTGLKNIGLDTWNKGKYKFKICVNRQVYTMCNFLTAQHANFALHKFLELKFSNSTYKNFFRLSDVDDTNITTEQKLDIIGRVSDYILTIESIMHLDEINIDLDSRKYISKNKKKWEITIPCNSTRFYFGKYHELDRAKTIRGLLIECMNTVIRQFNRGDEIDYNIIHEVDEITDNPIVHKNFIIFLDYIKSLQ